MREKHPGNKFLFPVSPLQLRINTRDEWNSSGHSWILFCLKEKWTPCSAPPLAWENSSNLDSNRKYPTWMISSQSLVLNPGRLWPSMWKPGNVWRHFWLLSLEKVLLASHEWRPGMSPHTLQCTGQFPTRENDSVQNINRAKAEKPGLI